MFLWILYMFCASSYLISEYACSKMCFSCTDLQETDTCQHVIRCADNEICFTQQYTNSLMQTFYSLGCTNPELCRKDSLGVIFGRRNTEHSHVLCHKCCDSSFCNMELKCVDDSKATTISCLSCSGVESPVACHNTTNCGQAEKCYIHQYKTGSGNTLYDLGCKHQSACLNKYDNAANSVGKRTDSDIHLTCESCCNDHSMCNKNLSCSHIKQKNLNESCSSSNECLSNLVCSLGKCACPTVDYFWSNNACIIKKTNLEKCQLTAECIDTLFCNHGECKCDRIDYWTGNNCTKRKTFGEACSTDDECQEFSYCLNQRCACLQSNIHCQQKKPLECADIDFTTDGLYLIYPDGTHSVEVNCVIREGLKWTVFQRRLDGSVDFNRTWNEYKTGFGSSSGEFWLGNDIIHLISSNGHHQLRVEMSKEGQNYYADYSQFLVESESNNYRINVTGYHGNAGDSLSFDTFQHLKHNGMDFATRDRDNDEYSGNCAAGMGSGSGWWYNACYAANLNTHPGSWSYDIGGVDNIESSQIMVTRIST